MLLTIYKDIISKVVHTGMLDNIRIVLMETSHPGNIGGAARAMKNMCVSELVLVNPKDFPSGNAKARAAGADNILQNARVVTNLDDALQDCTLVVGASARLRTIPWPELSPRSFAEKSLAMSDADKIAVVFGNETSGMDNAALDRCQYLLNIPANPEYSSLNLGAAVQVVCYELYQQYLLQQRRQYNTDADEQSVEQPGSNQEKDFPIAPRIEVERMYEHMEEALTQIGFLDPKAPRQLMRRLRRLYNRAEPDAMEINILRGIMTAVQSQVK